MAPGVVLVGAARRHQLADHGRQDGRRVLVADQLDALEGLVDEVQRMAAVGKRPVGDRDEQHRRQPVQRQALVDGGEQRALGGVAMPPLGPLAKPALERGDARPGAGERCAIAARRHAVAIGGHPPDALEQRQVGLLLGQDRQQVGERGHDGHADAEAVAMAGAEQRCIAHQRGIRDAGGARAEHRLGDHEAEIVRHAVAEAAAPVAGRIGEAAFGGDPDLAVLDPRPGGRHVVGPQVERAAAFEIEAGMMPVAGEDAVLDAALVQRKAQMRAAVVERMHLALLVDHQERAVPPPDHHPAARFQIVERADVNPVPCRDVDGHDLPLRDGRTGPATGQSSSKASL